MKALELKELQAIELRLLKQVDEVCRRENIRYFLAEGTMLGAVREKGIIPWDDDVDIAMPRPDYERFVAICQKEELPFRMCCTATEPRYGYTYGKVMAPDTELIEDVGNRGGVDMGVFVDIFPLDGAGNSPEEALAWAKKNRLLHALVVASNWRRYKPSLWRNKKQEIIRLAAFVITRFTKPGWLAKRLEKRYKSIPYESSSYVYSPMSMRPGYNVAPRVWLEETVCMDFEDSKFPVPVGYHEWLTDHYHDYMTPPPPEKRGSVHSFDVYYRGENTLS